MDDGKGASMDDRDADARRHRRAFGAAVFELRARRGFSQEALGFRGGLHRNYVGAIERGEINPTLRVILKFCDGLGVPMTELVAVYERQLAAREARCWPGLSTRSLAYPRHSSPTRPPTSRASRS
jgi:transcriptional regulator with XRE-family HTH domain